MSSALSDIFMLLQLVVGWKQHDRQCTYNITLRHGPATTAAERKKFYIFNVRVGSMQSAFAILYFRLWPVWPDSIFPHYLINGMVFGKKVTEHKMCVFIFSTAFI